MDNAPLLEHLKQRHRFGEWRGRNALPETLFIVHFRFGPRSIPDWRLSDAQQIPASPPRQEAKPRDARAASSPDGYPLCTQSIWRHPLRSGAILNATSFECVSREAAHELLIRLLTQFQSPVIERRDNVGLGDVTFSGPSEASIVFARANLVHLLRNAGRDVVPIFGIARQLDRDLVDKPESVALAAIASRTKTAAPKIKLGEMVRLPEEDMAPSALRGAKAQAEPASAQLLPMHKLFASSGDIFRDKGLKFKPSSTGLQAVDDFAVDPDGTVIRRRFEYMVA